MPLSEPITTLTDYAITVVAWFCAIRLWQKGQRTQQVSVCCWAIAFAWVGMGAAAGGTVHGTVHLLPRATRWRLWNLSLASIGLASSFLLVGTVFSTVAKRWQRWCLWGIGAATLIYGYGVFTQDSFGYAIAAYGLGLGIVLLVQIHALRQHPSPSAWWILSSIGISFLAGTVLAQGITVGVLVASDLYHLIQLPGLYALYRGVRRLRDVT